MLSWIEISKKNVLHNIKAFRKLIGSERLLMPVIKANAYGHGMLAVGEICDAAAEVDMLCTASLNEAIELRQNQIKKPILVLSYYDLDEKDIAYAVQSNIVFPIYTLAQAQFLNAVGERVNTNPKVHIKIDTGTTRVGVKLEDLNNFVLELKKCSRLTIEGLWSHFSSSESNPIITRKQRDELLFAECILIKNDITVRIKHIACTAASILYKDARLDATRLGLGLYGLYSAPQTKKRIQLKPVLCFKTTIIQVKKVTKGTKISYNGTYTMPHDGVIAVLPVGYGDGYSRGLSNKSEVLVKGIRCPVRGRICMNLMMIEVTKVKNCAAGDTVTLIGPDKKDSITIDELAKLIPETINYEIPTSLSPALPRKVV